MPQHRPPHLDSAPMAARVAGLLDAFCAAERIPPSIAWRLRVVLDELVANILTHGARGGGEPIIDVSFRRDGRRIEMTVADNGMPFDPLAHPAPDVTLPLEARPPGGVGLALVRALTDDACYARTDRNILRLGLSMGPDAAADPESV